MADGARTLEAKAFYFPPMISEYYHEYRELGLSIYPITWDTVKKEPTQHPKWSDAPKPLNQHHNAIMVKCNGDYGCLDFDLKNTDRKTIFDEWKQVVLMQEPDIWNKLFIESTRNNGYHVWLRYKGLTKKMQLAKSVEAHEVIALYAKGPLVYTFPTPGYTEVSGSMADLPELNQREYDYLIRSSQAFNEYTPDYDPTVVAVNYPKGFEQLLSQFDTNIDDDTFEQILHQVGLFEIPNYSYHTKDKFRAYKRKKSDSDALSAKVYFGRKRVLIFSASMDSYPNWHNKADYPTWSLPASFLLFYKNKRNWDTTIDEINGIIESTGIDINIPEPPKKGDYPLHVFPKIYADSIMEVSTARSLAPQFVATAGLWTISSLAGTRYKDCFRGEGKNILFCLLIAPVSVGKTPAFKVMCETPLTKVQEEHDHTHARELAEWEEEKAKASVTKKAYTKKRPSRYIPIAKDGTTEGYLNKSMGQPNGIGVYQDEAESILNAGSFKSNNDSISFFTQAFSGGRVAQIRADETKERVIPNLNLNLLMGTQPSRVKNIFSEDRLSSGFASRFLMVESDYMELNNQVDPFGERKEMCKEWVTLVGDLYWNGNNYNSGISKQVEIQITDSAKELYRSYYRQLLTEGNQRILSKAETYIIGTEAKMSAYFPRLIQVLTIMHSPSDPVVTEELVQGGWELYRYYADSTIKVISALHGEIETGLPSDLELLYQALPEEFTRKEATEVCTRINLNPRRFDVSIRRKDFAVLFRKIAQGQYKKT